LPEELRVDYEPYVVELEKQYKDVVEAISYEVVFHNLLNHGDNWRKTVGLYLASHDVKYSQGIFPFLLGRADVLDKYVAKQIRPDGNNMKVMNE